MEGLGKQTPKRTHAIRLHETHRNCAAAMRVVPGLQLSLGSRPFQLVHEFKSFAAHMIRQRWMDDALDAACVDACFNRCFEVDEFLGGQYDCAAGQRMIMIALVEALEDGARI